MKLKIGCEEWFALMISILLLADLAVIFNIPFLRQIVGFFFLTIFPGLLILQILKLDKIDFTERLVLSVGLSISFLMFFGLFLNTFSLNIGYSTPLATSPLLISLNIAFIALTIVGYKINKNLCFPLTNIKLTTSEKGFLIVPILFPALSIFGMHVMNTTDNNIILMFLYLLIAAYVIFVCFSNQKFPKRLYPVVIFLIGISLVLLIVFRSNHILGVDAHLEYYYFQTTRDNLHWCISGHSALNACLSISLLPAIYQSILNVPSEFLFKVIYPVIYSTSPLLIYILSKKYVRESYAFLASCFFMFQYSFLSSTMNARTGTAVFFFVLTVMILFNDKIDPLTKKILFIVFMASCMVSHYATTYIFLFILLGTFIGIEILPKKYEVKKVVSLTITIIFFALIFFWYSQVTETAFSAGISFIGNTFSNLNAFFVEEARSSNVLALLGEDIGQKGIPHKIEFIFTWLTFAFIGIGIITLIRRYKEMSFPELNFKSPDFLRDKIDVTYFMIAVISTGILFAMIVLPFISRGYGMHRLYSVGIAILSVFFVIGGIVIANYLNKLLVIHRRKALTKNALQVRTYLIILLILIPYFFCVTGVTYQVFDYPRAITLNSGGEHEYLFVHDQDSCGAKWSGDHIEKRQKIYTDFIGGSTLTSQGAIPLIWTDRRSLIGDKKIKGYIYLRCYNTIGNKIHVIKDGSKTYNMSDYTDIFSEKNEIYNNGGSRVLR